MFVFGRACRWTLPSADKCVALVEELVLMESWYEL